ncbi:C6 zinc finger domain-containing protein [Penicillium bovifimosum]|uniref:C6 zinc finger domain-containing protein n=1 Tax=Penicillium bovifimosum TaxID=126998 RepID=A0A9W9GW02_9EURO|nr:C6 zinc finger domain-containing protein [Penicillium bovifimosum]KAJ5130269.1 C6 zinc finger domain-containing protein [Penicillium bovifimosum]
MGSMAMATHMSACESLLRGTDYAHARDRVRLFLGILRVFEGVWPEANKWSLEMRLMAKAVFDNRDKAGNLIADPLGALTQIGDDGSIEQRVNDGSAGSIVESVVPTVLALEALGEAAIAVDFVHDRGIRAVGEPPKRRTSLDITAPAMELLELGMVALGT